MGLIMSMYLTTQAQKLQFGSLTEFKQSLTDQLAPTSARSESQSISLSVPDKELNLKVNFFLDNESNTMLSGSVENAKDGSFYLHITNNHIKGNIILKEKKQAFEFNVHNNQVVIEEVDINKVLCISFPKGDASTQRSNSTSSSNVAYALTDLQSLPGAATCVLLDFDGYNLQAGTGWLNGNSWYAPPSGMSDAAVQEAWELISEDFRPFNVNITTNESVYNSYPVGSRQRCVFTTDNAPAPGAGGVAYVGAFGYNDWPCWVFITSGKAGGEAASHEIGHTVGLGHDGRTNPNEGYFAGHGDWAPIMGVGYYRNISQWSKGEYAYANNGEDDLSIMSGYVPYRNDDHSNGTGGATFMGQNGSGALNQQYGVIQSTGDTDFFRFETGTGNITINVNTVSRHGDLDILVRLYEGNGNQIGTFNGSGLNAQVNAYLGAGTYYIGVDGTGAGNPATDGYSDYASLGSYWVDGNVVVPTTSGVATLYQHCNYGGYAINLTPGSYTLGDLQARGLVNDDVSSIRVSAGYRAILFWDNNFTGSSLTKTGDDACLVDDGWNDQATSIIIEATTSVSVIEAESYSSMAGVQLENCSEGGQNVGWIDANDWMAYNSINFPGTGNYLVEYRVASANGGGRLSLDLNAGATQLGALDIPNTGGWQNWTTISHTVYVNAGTYNVGVFAQSGGWNLNWLKITQQGGAAAASGQSFTQSSTLEATSEKDFGFELYPNPAVEQVTLRLPADWTECSGAIVDLKGASVWKGQLQGNQEQAFDLTGLNKGIYTLILSQNGEAVFKRFIKE